MTDGPHKTLPMSRAWKKAAEIADALSHGDDEVVEAIEAALASDLRSISQAIIKKVIEIVGTPMISTPFTLMEIEALKQKANENDMTRDFFDRVVSNIEKEPTDKQNVVNALKGLIVDFFNRRCRQVCEHYLRESTKNRALRVRSRIMNNLKMITETLANGIVSPKNNGIPSRYKKRTGLDDGPA